ncbi:MAG: hypothetical protein ACJ74Z_03035 [Bryobacteraceae bacterium]
MVAAPLRKTGVVSTQGASVPPLARCNTLQAQREAAEAYILSQKQSGWHTLPDTYDDGGFSGVM